MGLPLAQEPRSKEVDATMECCKIKNDVGTIFITEDVILKVVGYAALECYGIVAMSSKRAKDGFVEWLGKENLTKGVRVNITDAGIDINQVAITENGEVVGLVTEAGPNYAVVKTVLDSTLEISATIASSGYNGMVQGGYATGEEGYLRMNYLPSDAVICNHDQVVTAGSTLYPRDLVLGSVIDAGFDETGVAKFAILEPAADFGSLEQVFVLTSYATE